VLEPQMPRAPHRIVADRGTADRPAMRRVSHAFAVFCRRSIRLLRSFAKRLNPSDGLGDLGLANDAASWMSCLVRPMPSVVARPQAATDCSRQRAMVRPTANSGCCDQVWMGRNKGGGLATAAEPKATSNQTIARTPEPSAGGNFVLREPPFRRIC
jgi:hypothetical protein